MSWFLIGQVGQAINAISDKVSGIGNVVFSPEQVIDKHATQLELTPAERELVGKAVVRAKALEDLSSMQPQTLSALVLLLSLAVQKRAMLMGFKAEDEEDSKDMVRPRVTVADVVRVTMVSAPALKKLHAKAYDRRHLILPEEYLKQLAARNLEVTPTRDLD